MKLLLGLFLLAMGPLWSQPYFGVYRWATSPDFVDAYAKWIGHDLIWAEDFEASAVATGSNRDFGRTPRSAAGPQADFLRAATRATGQT